MGTFLNTGPRWPDFKHTPSSECYQSLWIIPKQQRNTVQNVNLRLKANMNLNSLKWSGVPVSQVTSFCCLLVQIKIKSICFICNQQWARTPFMVKHNIVIKAEVLDLYKTTLIQQSSRHYTEAVLGHQGHRMLLLAHPSVFYGKHQVI